MSSRIFVGNLSFETQRDELTTLLSQAGQVVDVHIPTDRNTGRSRGFAFVEFASPDEAAKAIETFDGHELGGRNLRINEADDRPRRPPMMRGGPSGSFGGGFPGRGGGGGGRPPKAKGSRRNLRGKKRSL